MRDARREPGAAGGAARRDTRLADDVRLHTKGVSGSDVIRAQPRPFLHSDPRRDVAHDRAFVDAHARDFHTRVVADFSPAEMQRWRRGVWRNEWHYGRRGWWWETDGVWYGYPEPVWPYPAEVAVLTAYDTAVVDGPDMSSAELGADVNAVPGEGQSAGAPGQAASADAGDPPGQAAQTAIQPLPAAPAGWYRCERPGGYYPVVASCPASWVLVQDTPMPGEQ